ncbi:hypothetical protein [Candidatus Jettenia sp. AMX1]|nr:hypothetical protein [Candidatus Jettenia sp. AMX1]WKZ15367.1 MAG: hypothetical protein QY317_15835 [Candidatus Jettenia caeni]
MDKIKTLTRTSQKGEIKNHGEKGEMEQEGNYADKISLLPLCSLT